jgi:hypothetical protein
MILKEFFFISKWVLMIFKFSKNTPTNSINSTFGKLGRSVIHLIFEKLRPDFRFLSRKLRELSKLKMTEDKLNHCEDFFLYQINSKNIHLYCCFWNGQVKKFLKNKDNFELIQSISINDKALFSIIPLDENKLICGGKNSIHILDGNDLKSIYSLKLESNIYCIENFGNKFFFCGSDRGIEMFLFEENKLEKKNEYLVGKRINAMKKNGDNLYVASNKFLFNFFFNGSELKEEWAELKKITVSFPIIDIKIDESTSQIFCLSNSKIYILHLSDAQFISSIDNFEKSFFSHCGFTGFEITSTSIICSKENGEITFYSRKNLDQINEANINTSLIKKLILINNYSDFIFATKEGYLNLYTLHSK